MWILFWCVLSVVVGVFAAGKGRSGVGWFLLSMLISPLLAAIFLAIVKDLSGGAAAAGPSDQTHVKCPVCAEFVLPEAKVCKHCAAPLTPDGDFYRRRDGAKAIEESADRKSLWMWGGIIVLVAFLLSGASTCSA